MTNDRELGAAAGAQTSTDAGQTYLAYWETRNLRMVANIRAAMAAQAKNWPLHPILAKFGPEQQLNNVKQQ